jgi:RNA polymerase sigma factor (sigma-70 family)
VRRRGLTGAGLNGRRRFAGDDRLTAAVRRGDPRAFEAIYDRFSVALLRFGFYMLGSEHDAEDAVQATFTAAYRALLADERTIALRPWLFTIVRNECVSILRNRRQTAALNGEPAFTEDPVHHLEVSEEVRQMLTAIRDLPERQRAALVLAEAQGLTHPEIAAVLGVDVKQVKAFVYQARANLLADRGARETSCAEIRRELAEASGPLLLRGRLRRHLLSCPGCREYRNSLARQRRRLHVALPLLPSLALKQRALEGALGLGGSYTGATAAGVSLAGLAEVAGGVNALVVKVIAGTLALSVTAGVGVGAAVLTAAHSPRPPVSSDAPRPIAATAHPAGVIQTRSPRILAVAGVRAHQEHRGATAATPTGETLARAPVGPRSDGASVGLAQGAAIDERQHGASAAGGSSERHPSHGPSKTTGSEHRVKAPGREAAREQHSQEHEKHQTKHVEHTAPPVKQESHGPEEHHPEGVAKGPPSEVERQHKHETPEHESEEHKPELGPQKSAAGRPPASSS